jgi:alpha-amylase
MTSQDVKIRNVYFRAMNIHFDPVSWSLNTNIYEVNLRQYFPESTFQSFIKELPRLADMGIKILWFMPIMPISHKMRQGKLGSYYACSAYTDTNPEYGTVSDFKDIVKIAHDNGMKVIIDWVANHTGWDHEWTRTNPGFYKKNANGEFYDGNGWADVIDLNFYDQAMRNEMISAMEFWIKECDIDGFRCDMAHLVPFDFWRDARRQLETLKPLFWLAETEDDNYQYAFDCSYAWKFMHLSENIVKQQAGVDELRLLLSVYLKKRLPYTNHLFFTSNHDENSWNGTEYEKYGPAALCFAVFTCTWNGLTLVYSGQELPNHKRLAFFDKDPIQWTGKYELHDFYKKLLCLRSAFGEEATEIITLDTTGDRHIFTFLKISRFKQILVILNFSGVQQKAHIENSLVNGTYRDLFTDTNKEAPSIQNILMEPWSYLVLEKLT